MHVFRKEVKDRGICLGNCKEYGSQEALRAVLRNKRWLIVPRDKAKKHRFVKMCLIEL